MMDSPGIDNQLPVRQEFISNIDGGLQASSSISPQVQDQLFHPFGIQIPKGFCHFIMGCCREIIKTDIADRGFYHVRNIQTIDRDYITGDGIIQKTFHPFAENGNIDFSTLFPFQFSQYIIVGDLDPGYIFPFNLHDPVAGLDTQLFRGSAGNRIDYRYGIAFQSELYTDTFKTAHERIVGIVKLSRRDIDRMRIQALQHPCDRFLLQLVPADGIHIILFHIIDYFIDFFLPGPTEQG